MTPKFAVGEIAIYIGGGLDQLARRINHELEIVTIGEPMGNDIVLLLHFARATAKAPNSIIYGIRWSNGNPGYVREDELKKRQPPEQLQRFRDTLRPADKSFGDIMHDCNKQPAKLKGSPA